MALEDCMLLQHIFWHRPEEMAPIADHILSQLVAADGCAQAEYIFTGELQSHEDSD